MKKALAFIMLIILSFSLVACKSTTYEEITNTSMRGKKTTDLNIRYNSSDNSLRWNAVEETNTYTIQINEYSKTIEGNAIWFKEALENGIYTVSITPDGYKTVTTLLTIGVKNQKSDIKEIFIITLLLANILAIGTIVTIYFLKKKKTTAITKEHSTDYVAEEDSLTTPSEKISLEKQYYKKIQNIEDKLKECEEEKEILKEEIKVKEEQLTEINEKLNGAMTQIETLKSAPPKIQEKIVYKTIETTKDFGKFKKKSKDYRKQHDANICCADGHYVRSKAEKMIDDFFYYNKIPHVYEKIFTDPKTGQQCYADFYLPDAKLYIEYFGLDTEEYKEKRSRKEEAYKNDPNINFEFLDKKDDDTINDKLQNICTKYKIPFTF